MTFKIPFTLPGLNDMLDAAKRNPHVWARMKKKLERDIAMLVPPGFPEAKATDGPAAIAFTWVEPIRKRKQRRDLDNIMAGQKFILDALVGKRVIYDDSTRYVREIRHNFMELHGVDESSDVANLELPLEAGVWVSVA